MEPNDASETLMEVHSGFHCAYEYEYSQVKDRMQNAVDKLETVVDEVEKIPPEAETDLQIILDVATEVADGDRPLKDGQAIADLIEFGLAWYIEDPEECPGYAPECKARVDDFDLQIPAAE